MVEIPSAILNEMILRSVALAMALALGAPAELCQALCTAPPKVEVPEAHCHTESNAANELQVAQETRPAPHHADDCTHCEDAEALASQPPALRVADTAVLCLPLFAAPVKSAQIVFRAARAPPRFHRQPYLQTHRPLLI